MAASRNKMFGIAAATGNKDMFRILLLTRYPLILRGSSGWFRQV